MQKSKTFRRVVFPADVLVEAIEQFDLLGDAECRTRLGNVDVERLGEHWGLTTVEEWQSLVRTGADSSLIDMQRGHPIYDGADQVHSEYSLSLSTSHAGKAAHTRVEVSALDATSIERVFRVLERRASEFEVPPEPEPAPVVFIGHGRSQLYRDLKDHLADHHNLDVQVFESGSRAGHTVRDILDSLLQSSSVAFLVFTAEDEQGDGSLRARQNVVHEAGLFQGKLGWNRAIVLVEEGVEVFSNLDGVQQIRFPPGRIRETFGEAVGVIHREFGRRSG